MASEDSEFNRKVNQVKLKLGTDSLPALLVASLEAGHTHYITPSVAIITTQSPRKHFEVSFRDTNQSVILRNLLIEVMWEVYREG